MTSHPASRSAISASPRVTLGTMPGRVTNFTNIVSLLGAFLATSLVLGLLGPAC